MVKKKSVKVKDNSKYVKVAEKVVSCLSCIRMNRIQNIVDGICLTCKQGNRKQNIV